MNVLQKLGPNKVTLSIMPNAFEESSTSGSHDALSSWPFDDIPDPAKMAASSTYEKPAHIHMFFDDNILVDDGRKPWVFERSEELFQSVEEAAATLHAELAEDYENGIHKNKVHENEIYKNKVNDNDDHESEVHDRLTDKYNKHIQPNGINFLYYIFAKRCDNTLDLYDNEEIAKRTETFKKDIIKQFEVKQKDLELKKYKITTESLQNDPHHILIYITKLLDLWVLLQDENTNESLVFKGKSTPEYVTVIQCKNKNYTEQNHMSIKECHKIICTGIENKLVKELRDIAGTLGINIYDANNKLLPKKLLLDKITSTISI